MILVEHDRSSAQGATAIDSAIDLALMARNCFSTRRPGRVAQLKGKRQMIQSSMGKEWLLSSRAKANDSIFNGSGMIAQLKGQGQMIQLDGQGR